MDEAKTGFEVLRRRYDTAVFEKLNLSSGVEIWVQKPPIVTSQAGTVIALWGHVGSWRDPQERQGLAHFFEHIPFTGTKAFPDRNQLFHTINELGGAMNASTGRMRTAYYATGPTPQFSEVVRIVSELALRPLIRTEDIDKERGDGYLS